MKLQFRHFGIRSRARFLVERLGFVAWHETTYLGRPFRYPRESLIGRFIASGEPWDAELRVIADTFLQIATPFVCEVGSNIGASLLQILQARPYARVLAVEPARRFRPFLRHNLAAAGFPDVEISPLLLGPAVGAGRLFTNTSTGSVVHASYHGHAPRGSEHVRMTTLDDLCRGRPTLDFLKIDTDGFDFEVLKGGEATLGRDRPVVFFEFDPSLGQTGRAGAQADLKWLFDLGYQTLACFDNLGHFIGVTKDLEQVTRWATDKEWREYCDILACHDGTPAAGLVAELEARLAPAPQ